MPLTVVSGVHEVFAEVTAEHPLPQDAGLFETTARRPGGDEAPAASHHSRRHQSVITASSRRHRV